VAVALADKLDTLVGFWAVDEKPTGSKDPYALRRAALGVVRIILENEIRLGLKDILFNASIPFEAIKLNALDGNDDFDTLQVFMLDRLRGNLRDKGFRHDIINAALATGGDDLVAIVERVKALQDFLTTEEGNDLLAGYKRAANILKAEEKKGALPKGSPNKPSDPHGAALYDALQTASGAISLALQSEDFEKSMRALAHLKAPIDAFFTDTQIISNDIAVKENNLRLLGLIRDTAAHIADFDAIDG